MKKEAIIRTAAVALLSASVFVACKDDNNNENSLGIPEKVNVADNAVDLGLTSGTKWAKMNIGATNPWDFGDYFAWGETTTKSTYDWNNYLHLNKAQAEEGQEWNQINKYQLNDGENGSWYSNVKFVGDNKTTLDPEDDAAAVNWGGDWVMPTPQDFQELRGNCEFERTGDYKGTGVAGFIFKGNGNEVFFPFAGFAGYSIDYVYMEGQVGPLWTNELGNWTSGGIHIWTLERDLTNYDFKNDAWTRTVGAGVRAVCKAGGNTNGHDAVDLGLPSGKLWAAMNIGAEKVGDYGYYLSWGETEPKEIYNDSTYKYMVKTDLGWSYTKYQVEDGAIGGVWYTKDFSGDEKTQLDDVDDAAIANWGGKWRMPTKEQIEELENECYWLYTENYAETTNVKGYIIYKAKEAKDRGKRVTRTDLSYIGTEYAPIIPEGYTLADTHIFMPGAGYKTGEKTALEGNYGYFWSSTLTNHTEVAYSLNIDQPYSAYSNQRYQGLTVRPVCK